MKTISLWQPWASAIACGLKTIETRHWPTNYRGPLAIHAAKRWTNEERQFWFDHVTRADQVKNRAAFRQIGILNGDLIPRGCIVAICRLIDCTNIVNLRHLKEPETIWGNYSEGRYGWILADIISLAFPIPCIGRQGLFEWIPPEDFSPKFP